MATAATASESAERPEVEVRRSSRRRRTVAAYREDDKVIVMIPARLSVAEEHEWVATMVARLERSDQRRRPSDSALLQLSLIHISEPTRRTPISYAVFCLKK